MKWKKPIFYFLIVNTSVFALFLYNKISYNKPLKVTTSTDTDRNVSSKIAMNPQNITLCIPDVQCIQMNYPILDDIKKGNLKPAPKLRTVYLNTIGRFGNLLYQFAFLLSFSKATCARVQVASRHKHVIPEIFEDFPFELVSDMDYGRLTQGIPFFDKIGKPMPFINMTLHVLKEDIRINGVFVGFGWGSGCFNEIKHKLRLKRKYINEARSIINEFTEGKRNVTTVGIHIRMGDKATDLSYADGYRTANMTFFNKAMSHFQRKYNNAIFIVTTDDMKWVKENFPKYKYPNVSLALNNSFYVDFALLMQCDHVIQSGGTFGEWAAYLNGHESVYFRDDRVCPYNTGKCDPSKYRPPTKVKWPGWVPMTNE